MGDDTLFGFKRMVLVAGVAGVVLGIVFNRRFTWYEALTATISGGCCVCFGTPVAVEWFKLSAPMEYLVAWLLGMLGMGLVTFAFASVRDPWAVYDRLRGRSPGGPA